MENEPNDIGAESTAELVHELALHGRRYVELEVKELTRELRHELDRARGELGRTKDGLVDEAKTIMAEARDRFDLNVNALKIDLGVQVGRTTAAAKPLAIGAALAQAGILGLMAALTLGLATFMPAWAAALMVGLFVAALGAALLASGARAAKGIGREALPRTNLQLKENKRWIQGTKETIMARIRSAKSTLSGIELPKLHLSSNDARNRLT